MADMEADGLKEVRDFGTGDESYPFTALARMGISERRLYFYVDRNFEHNGPL